MGMLIAGTALASTAPLKSIQHYQRADAQHDTAQYLSMRETEKALLNEFRKTGNPTVFKPIIDSSGAILYPFGQVWPTVVCAPLHVTVLRLQKGETVNDVSIGDSARWKLAPAKSGKRENIVIKPLAAGLSTNLVVTTNRRTYYLSLISQKSSWVPEVGFYYPADLVQHWNQSQSAEKAAKAKQRRETVGRLPSLNADALDFRYSESGKAPRGARPVRVFSDGTHTYIQMPRSIGERGLPVLEGRQGGKDLILNYQWKRPYFVVDSVPSKMALIYGRGGSVENLLIKREGASSSGGYSFSISGTSGSRPTAPWANQDGS